MRHFTGLCLLLVCIFTSTTPTYAQTAPALARIGRGTIESFTWHPNVDYIMVSTITGVDF